MIQKVNILRAQNNDYRLAGHTVEAEEQGFYLKYFYFQ